MFDSDTYIIVTDSTGKKEFFSIGEVLIEILTKLGFTPVKTDTGVELVDTDDEILK